MARPGGVHFYRRGGRPTAGLFVRRDVPKMDGLQSGRGAHLGRLGDLHRHRGPGARRNAARGRPRPRGRTGVTTQESRLTLSPISRDSRSPRAPLPQPVQIQRHLNKSRVRHLEHA